MEQNSPTLTGQVRARRATIESLFQQGFAALEASPPSSTVDEWRMLLERLEDVTSSSPSTGSKDALPGDATIVQDIGHDDLPKRLLREAVAYLRVKDSDACLTRETAKIRSIQARLERYLARKSTLSTGTSVSTLASAIGSDMSPSSSLSSLRFYATSETIEAPSPSPLKFTFTRTHSNSFAVDVFSEENIPQRPSHSINSSPTASPTRVNSTKVESPPRVVRRSRSDLTSGFSRASIREPPYSSLHGISIDEDVVQDAVPFESPRSPTFLQKKPSKHRHSRSLPMLSRDFQRPTTQGDDEDWSPDGDISTRGSSTLSFGGLIRQHEDLLHQAMTLPIPQVYVPESIASTRRSQWTEHENDSWEVVPPSVPPKSPKHSPLPPLPPPEIDNRSGRSRGLERLKRRISKSQLHLKTSSLSGLTSFSTHASLKVEPTPVNVNCVVLGPPGCGVSTLIQRFVSGSKEWIPPATIDDFWHHVVRTESRTIYYNISEVTGVSEYADLRMGILRRAQVVILCFKLDSREQFKDAIVRLVEEIHAVGHIPIVLVGTFQDSPDRQVTSDEAHTAAEALQASYYECSPRLGRGVNELFSHVANVLHASYDLSPIATPPPASTTKALFDRVRGRLSHQHHSSIVTPPLSTNSKKFNTVTSIGSTASAAMITGGFLNIRPLQPRHFKCVLLGSKSSGRRNLVHRYLHGTFECLPETPWMTWKAAVQLSASESEADFGMSNQFALILSETGSSKALDGLRRSTYQGVNVFVICFNVCDYREENWKEVRERWIEECRLYNPQIPVILVATKIDLRQGTLLAWTKPQGQALAKSLRAAAYIECSSLTGEGVDLVFQTIVRVASERER